MGHRIINNIIKNFNDLIQLVFNVALANFVTPLKPRLERNIIHCYHQCIYIYICGTSYGYVYRYLWKHT